MVPGKPFYVTQYGSAYTGDSLELLDQLEANSIDLVMTSPVILDIFAGSNTTGFAAEAVQRRWLAFEQERQYLAASIFRFLDKEIPDEQARALYTRALSFHETLCIEPGKLEIGEDQEQTMTIINVQPSLFEV